MNLNNGKTVLVTGALGFIASNLSEKLLNKGYKVVGIDNFLSGNINNIKEFCDHSNYKFIRGDVNKFDTLYNVFYNFRPDYVYHYAACVGVERTLSNPFKVLSDIKGFENVLDLCSDFNIEKVLFSSSSEVYGEPVEFPQVEGITPLNSQLPYAVVKNIGEVYFKSYGKEHGLDFTILRFFNTYGPRQSSDFVVSRFIKQALLNQDLSVYGEGSQSRTFCYVDDNVDTSIEVLSQEFSNGEIVNIGSNIETTVLELAQIIIDITNSKSKIVHLPPLKEGDMARRQPDNSKMKIILQERELVSLRDGLAKTIEYIKKQN